MRSYILDDQFESSNTASIAQIEAICAEHRRLRHSFWEIVRCLVRGRGRHDWSMWFAGSAFYDAITSEPSGGSYCYRECSRCHRLRGNIPLWLKP